MPQTAYDPNEGNFKVVECKTCGYRMKVLKKQMSVMKVRCRNCHGSRWRVIG